MIGRLIRLWVYLWAGPNSLLGLLAASLALPDGRAIWRDGVLEASGGRLRWVMGRRIQAITLGHVILARDQSQLKRWRRHERVHVRQYERLGPAFLPVYLLLGVWQALRGRRPYRDHPLEREAGL